MFDGQCWWITGASSGIGAGLARALAKGGASLILSGRNVEALQAVARDCPDSLLLPFEATDFERIPGLVETAWAWKGKVDALVNNAGITQRSLAIHTDFAVYQRIVAVDLLAPIALTQQLLPRMVGKGGGTVVAISSVAGIVGAPLRTAYSAAKHGLIGYHDALRAETAHLGMRILVVAPGSVRTDISRNALAADGSARGVSDEAIENGMSPDEAAERILAALASGQRELLLATGMEHDIAVLRRQDPEALFDRISAMVQAGYARNLGVE